MQVNWNGLSSFTIKGKPIQGEVTLVTDPYESSTGLRFPRSLAAGLVVESHDAPEASNSDAINEEGEGKTFVVRHAGEYEVKGIFVTGISASKKDGTAHSIYCIDLEGMSVAFLGALDRKLSDAEVAALGPIDILIVPAGGGTVLDAKGAAEVVAQVEPRIVIPSYVNVKGLKAKLASADGICKELAGPREDLNKLKITKTGLPAEDMKIVVLSRA